MNSAGSLENMRAECWGLTSHEEHEDDSDERDWKETGSREIKPTLKRVYHRRMSCRHMANVRPSPIMARTRTAVAKEEMERRRASERGWCCRSQQV